MMSEALSLSVASEEDDARVSYVLERLHQTFGPPGPALLQAFEEEIMQEKMDAFFQDAELRTLTFDRHGGCASMASAIDGLKGPLLTFAKVRATAVPRLQDFRTHVCEVLMPAAPRLTSTSASVLEHMKRVARHLYYPVLTDGALPRRCGEVTAREVVGELHNFMASSSVIVSQIHGETQLPLPVMDLPLHGPSQELGSGGLTASDDVKNSLSLLEGAIIHWTRLIREVLRRDPEALLKQGMHPTPDVEIAFWKSKAGNLNDIFEQLQSPPVRRMLRLLDQYKSAYSKQFSRLCKEVFNARLEANDNVKYLRTLDMWFARLKDTTGDFEKLEQVYQPVLHILLLIWKNSKHYNSPANLVVIVREICNAIIEQATAYISGRDIFDAIECGNVEAARDRLRVLLRVCGKFKATYFEYKTTASAECPANPWRIQNNALFLRLDSFMERCYDLLNMVSTILHFNMLSDIEVGGTKGRELTGAIKLVHTDFQHAVGSFRGVSYDLMEVRAAAFDADYAAFCASVAQLERRLAAIIGEAFNDCTTLPGRFRLLDNFDQLLKRESIRDELERNHVALANAYIADLRAVQECFVAQRDHPPISWNLPPSSGALYWCAGLAERVDLPMARLVKLESDIFNREEGHELLKMHAQTMAALREYENQKVEEWAREVESASHADLTEPLLTRSGTGRLFVNFNPALVRLLREVRYFLSLGHRCPDAALEVFRRSEELRRHRCSLDTIARAGNTVLNRMLPVERPLVGPFLQAFDAVVNEGVHALTWNSDGIESFIRRAREEQDKLEEMQGTLKVVLGSSERLIASWLDEPMFQRKQRSVDRDEFERNLKVAMRERYERIKSSGREILAAVKSAGKILRTTASPEHWKAYVDFINGVVLDGLTSTACESLAVLQRELQARATEGAAECPLLEVHLDIVGKGILLQPPFTGPLSLRRSVQRWISGIFHIGSLIKRVCTDDAGTFTREMRMEPRVHILQEDIEQALDDSEAASREVAAEYEQFSALWLEDFGESFAAFVRSAIVAPANSMVPPDAAGPALTAFYPDVARFAEEMTRYGSLGELCAFKSTLRTCGWLRINCKRIHASVGALAQRRGAAYANFLREDLQQRLADLHAFMCSVRRDLNTISFHIEKSANPALGHAEPRRSSVSTARSACGASLASNESAAAHITPASGTGGSTASAGPTRDEVMVVMRSILLVRKNAEVPLQLFRHADEVLAVLKEHGVDLVDIEVKLRDPTHAADESCTPQVSQREDEDEIGTLVSGFATVSVDPATRICGIQAYLEEAPSVWDSLIKLTYQRREEILPFQHDRVEELRGELSRFAESLARFQEGFLRGAPFESGISSADAYRAIDGFLPALQGLEEQAALFNDLEDLFELEVSKWPAFSEVRTGLERLKECWDIHDIVARVHEEWVLHLWKDCDVDALETEHKLTAKSVTSLAARTPAVRGWGVFQAVEGRVRVMQTVIPLLHELRSPALRPRHWRKIASLCSMDAVDPEAPRFSLGRIFSLRMENNVGAVIHTVQEAEKEIKVERKLADIKGIWDELSLDYPRHRETDTTVLRRSALIQEHLEAHQVELQELHSLGQSIDHFRKKVEQWQVALGTVEDVLKIWLKVSKTWEALESIFLSSSDIRSQLLDDTLRFEHLDVEFKELMHEASMETNCLRSCTVPGRSEVLRDMWRRMELCEKGMDEYLSAKRSVFPRFYFVPKAALLDILANGSTPSYITRYLDDCYPALHDLRFQALDCGGCSPNRIDGLIARDGEELALAEPFVLEGEVEDYLTALTELVQWTLRGSIDAALAASVDWEGSHPRHEWVSEFPAQAVLTAWHIIWTEEAETALEEYEGGQDDALRRYLSTCVERIHALVSLVQKPLGAAERNKVLTLITADVHARDVVQTLCTEAVDGPHCHLWQRQLRFYSRNAKGGEEQSTASGRSHTAMDLFNVDVQLSDFETKYFFEWIGNTDRLVATPLTDRCFLTLTTALRLRRGGALSGPAGTGKTETVKELSRCLALNIYCVNASSQMTIRTLADLFRGLLSMGAWGCFDEFNRISVDVLSVVAMQISTIQDAIHLLSEPAHREPSFMALPAGAPPVCVGSFSFEGERVRLVPTCGFFITMNPTYAGRSNLPENLRALFRDCAMIRPDVRPICENMLMSEGFQTAAALAGKFVALYQLSSELLSNQRHYDWGLRAMKSVLRIAGELRRENLDLSEGQVLMRALRDANLPRIPAQDTAVFLRLLGDLFMGVYAPPSHHAGVRAIAAKAARSLGLQAEDSFLHKVLQFKELLDVRHSVMILGPTGSGKTEVWRTLQATLNLDTMRKVCATETLNPKALSSNELFGHMTLAHEWRDGVFSIIMRAMSKNLADHGFHAHQTSKWIVLDGDIDAVWIESMNTVMDDNKVLTLVSNERIPLSPSMRLVFEVDSLAHATPATVSRCGILCMNASDVGWRLVVDSWIARRASNAERTYLSSLVDKYVEPVHDFMGSSLETVTPVSLMSQVASLLVILEDLLRDTGLDGASSAAALAERLESAFFFAIAWAFGGAVTKEHGSGRKRLSDFLVSIFAPRLLAPLVSGGKTVFDFRYDPRLDAFVPWNVPTYVPMPVGTSAGETPFSSIAVPTADSSLLLYFMAMYTRRHRPFLICGGAGVGKSMLVRRFLEDVCGPASGTQARTLNVSYYTNSVEMQRFIEGGLEKRSGHTYGPPRMQDAILFLDDVNLPMVEDFGTQSAISLLTQQMGYGCIFDREDLSVRKTIDDVQFIATMNPKAGSMKICGRAQRLFGTFTCELPSEADLAGIYGAILADRFAGFPVAVSSVVPGLVHASAALLYRVRASFLPSASNFTYQWTMREMSSLLRGLCLACPKETTTPTQLCRLWAHESHRVFSDRLATEDEKELMQSIMAATLHESAGVDSASMLRKDEELVFARVGAAADAYAEVCDTGALQSELERQLREHNECKAPMQLVLFPQAVQQVLRMVRVLQAPGAHALLVGVSGSGRRSLSRLAAFICDTAVFQPGASAQLLLADFQDVMRAVLRNCIRKDESTLLLVSEGQITDERFLVEISELMGTGWVEGLFPKEELDLMAAAVAKQLRSAGTDGRAPALEVMKARALANAHVAFCVSPVDDVLRSRIRRFPALLKGAAIAVFRPWSYSALVRVGEAFIKDVATPLPVSTAALSEHMTLQHLSVREAAEEYRLVERRHVYVTPESFLELLATFQGMMQSREAVVRHNVERLAGGLATLRRTSENVIALKVDLEERLVDVAEKKVRTEKLVGDMGVQQEAANAEAEKARVEAATAAEVSREAEAVEARALESLAEAEPAMHAAAAAVDVLEKSMITELKGLNTPPTGVDMVTNAVLVLVYGEKSRNLTWKRAQRMMSKVDKFKRDLAAFDAKEIAPERLVKVEKYMSKASFTPENMSAKSAAAGNLCTWVVNVYRYNRIYVRVKPLMDDLDAAQERKAAADASLEAANAKVGAANAVVEKLRQQYTQATEEKLRVEADARACEERLALAERLVNGLVTEKERWTAQEEQMRESEATLVGDCLLSAGFVNYCGAFDQESRERLWRGTWLPDLVRREVPMSQVPDPIAHLLSSADEARMLAEGLPDDRVSRENGAIILSSRRFPLIVDPQGQGLRWLARREADTAVVADLRDRRWERAMEEAITLGGALILENVGDDMDRALKPLLAKRVTERGSKRFINFRGSDLEVHRDFRLYLQTRVSNPRCRPEVAAHTTLVNFTATERGLQDQLLTRVVDIERPQLEREAQRLKAAFHSYKLEIVQLEDDLLERLAGAPEDILSHLPLIEGLEATKLKASEINRAVDRSRETEAQLSAAREKFRVVAAEGAMLYFILTRLHLVEHMYQYSLDAFLAFFDKSIAGESGGRPRDRDADERDPTQEEVYQLKCSLRMGIYRWVSRGLFQRHRIILLAQIVFNLLLRGGLDAAAVGFSDALFNFLLRGAKQSPATASPLPWLPELQWHACEELSQLEGFESFCTDLVEAPSRFREWFNHPTPESERMPLDWAHLDRAPFKKLLAVRCLRPDRIGVALAGFIEKVLEDGRAFLDCDSSRNSLGVLEESFANSSNTTPLYFVVSPGMDVMADVSALAEKHGMTKAVTFHPVSMGQGQALAATSLLEVAHRDGHWVMLNNIHLLPAWLGTLERLVEGYRAAGSHSRFRLFLSSDPSDCIPIGILNGAIKLTNEAPQGLRANLKRTLRAFAPATIDGADPKTRSIIFGLCFFHSSMVERQRYNPIGMNHAYAFTKGDLLDSARVLQAFMDSNSGGRIVWDDLRYIFGRIIYGGKIMDDKDARVASAYLDWHLKDELLDEAEMYPFAGDVVSFHSCPPTSLERYVEHVDENIQTESPLAIGLHPNAEIDFRTNESMDLLSAFVELQPRRAGPSVSRGSPAAQSARLDDIIFEITEKLADKEIDAEDAAVSDDASASPFLVVLRQEVEILNGLIAEAMRSLGLLGAAMRGELTMSADLDALQQDLLAGKVPAQWEAISWPTMRNLADWLVDTAKRIEQCEAWIANLPALQLPVVTWLGGLARPVGFLTAVRQGAARRVRAELDSLRVTTVVTKKMSADSMEVPDREGAHVSGFFIEGARWDGAAGSIKSSMPRELYCPMPIITLRAKDATLRSKHPTYATPVYRTRQRAASFCFWAQLPTLNDDARRWTLAGVCLLLDPSG